MEWHGIPCTGKNAEEVQVAIQSLLYFFYGAPWIFEHLHLAWTAHTLFWFNREDIFVVLIRRVAMTFAFFALRRVGVDVDVDGFLPFPAS